MVRENIGLFRGKRIDNDEWVEGYLRHPNLVFEGMWFIEDETTANFEVDPETIGEYTGKSVKTGKVFAGDIGRDIDGLFLVRWDRKKSSFVMEYYGYPYETLYLEEMWDDAEIIGNIHDNPELLKGGED